MKRDIKIGVVGGDTRQLAAAAKLAEEGFSVYCYGTPKNDGRYKGFYRSSNLEDCVRGSAAVLLGVPYSTDGKWLRCPPEDYAISLKALLCAMTPGQLLLGGRLDEGLYVEAQKHSVRAIDYFTSEELTVLNAIPTAEGGVEIAMRECDSVLRDTDMLVCGFGRVGKVLAHTLKGLGCDVTVCCRRKSESAWCRAYGYSFLPLDSLCGRVGEYDIIFNTVPSEVFTRQVLCSVKGIIIDLASAPGGVDSGSADELGVRVIRALSLPGKVAPTTAGRFIAGSVTDILTEEGII